LERNQEKGTQIQSTILIHKGIQTNLKQKKGRFGDMQGQSQGKTHQVSFQCKEMHNEPERDITTTNPLSEPMEMEGNDTTQ
jgi:hypothetical protein